MSNTTPASNDAKQSLSGLPRRLVREEILTEKDALQALADANENKRQLISHLVHHMDCLLYTSPSPRDATLSRMPSSA